MQKLNHLDIADYINKSIDDFRHKKIQKLIGLTLEDIFRDKNPYLFKSKQIFNAHDFVKLGLDEYISDHDEKIFADLLKELAIWINEKIYNGHKSSVEGIDLEFENDAIHYIVSIKSQPNCGNDSEIARMRDNFSGAKQTLKSRGSKMKIVAVNGCCYGQDNQPDKGDHYQYCGQRFWQFISGDEALYMDIFTPLSTLAKSDDKFDDYYYIILNKFTFDFIKKFCSDYKIEWDKLVQFTSGP